MENTIQNLRPFNTTTRRPGSFPNHNKNRPKQYLTPLLRRLLNKKTNIADKEVQRVLHGKIGNKRTTFKAILMLRYILNGVEGETQAIEGILDRIDGKVAANGIIDQSTHYHFTKVEGDRLVAEAKRRGIPIPEEIARRFGDTRETE